MIHIGVKLPDNGITKNSLMIIVLLVVSVQLLITMMHPNSLNSCGKVLLM